MGLTPRALLGKPSIAFDTCSWIWHIPKTRYIDARLALWLHFTPQWKCRKPPSWHEGDAKRAHLKPVEDLLHSEVPLQNPAVPQAPLHVLKCEALHSHIGQSEHAATACCHLCSSPAPNDCTLWTLQRGSQGCALLSGDL